MTALVAGLNGLLRNASHALSKGHEPQPFRDLELVQLTEFYNMLQLGIVMCRNVVICLNAL